MESAVGFGMKATFPHLYPSLTCSTSASTIILNLAEQLIHDISNAVELYMHELRSQVVVGRLL